jgi:hypothetical protein
MRFPPTAVLLSLVALASARAADVRLPGSKLLLRKGPTAERLVLVARQDIVAPLPGSTEDPTLVGGELEIANPATGERARFTMSARDWAMNALGTIFHFQNHLASGPGSEVRTIAVKNRGRLKISTRALGITLDEEAQQALSVVMRTGTRRYCFLFGGRIGKDRPGRFVAHKAPAPEACPRPVSGPSTTTTSRPPGTRPTSTSVTTSTSTTSTAPRPTTTSTAPPGATTSTTTVPTSTTSTSRPPHPSTSSTSSTTATVQPTTSTSTSTSSSTTQPPPTSSSTQPPPPTTSTTQPPPTTTSTSPPTTSSTTSVPTTSTTTTTARPCGFRGNSCKGTCPFGLTCEVVLGLCACVAQ